MSNQKSRINHQSSDLCRLLFESAGEAILVVREGHIVDCNRQAGVILKTSPDKILGQPLSGFLPSLSAEGRTLDDVLQETLKATLVGEQPRLVWRLLTADQSVTQVEIVPSVVEFKGETLIQLLIHDITRSRQAEEELHWQERQYRHLVETSHDLIWSVDAEGRWTFVNQAARHIYGYEPEEMLGRPFMDFETPEQREKDLAVFARILAGESFFQYETEHLRKDGSPVILSFNAIVLRDEQGNVLGTTGTATDITARKHAEQMLAQERNLLQTVVDHLPAHIYVKDTRGRFVFGNAATLSSLGVDTLDELVGKTDFDFSPHELAAQFQADEQALFQAGQSPVHKEDIILDHMTGEKRWVDTTKVLLRDHQGQVSALVGINHDITERKLTEEELRHSQTQLKRQSDLVEQVQAAAKVGGWEIDLISNTLYWTAETYHIHEVSPDEYTPTVESAINYYAPESVPVITAAVSRAIETGEPWDHELELITAKKRRLWVRAVGQAEFNAEGQPVRVYGSFQDITERRQLEQQIRASLDRQARQLQLLTLIAQQTTVVTDLETLFERVVGWIKEQLGFYHVQLFRYEPNTQIVKLVAGYGEIGKQMLATGYQISLGEGLVGAAAAGTPLLHPDIASDPDWSPHPLLPETRGELVIPIMIGDEDATIGANSPQRLKRVLGVIDIHSDQANQLDYEDQLVLEGVAGQIASAIENFRLLDQAGTFQQLAEAAGQGFGMATLEGLIVYNNPTSARLQGLSHPEANYGQHILTLYPETLHQYLQKEILPTVLTQGEWQGELSRKLLNGKIVPTLENIFVVRNEKGELKYLANVFSDISTQKQAEAELQDRLDELSTLQRLMSREGWQAFQATHQEAHPGYLFDQTQIRPISFSDFEASGNGEDHAGRGNGHTLSRSVAVRGESIGQIGVYTGQPDGLPLNSEDQEFLDAVAEQVAEALERARLLEQAQRRVAELEIVAQVGAIASKTLEPEQLLQTVVDLTKRNFNLYHAHIYLLDETSHHLVLAAGTGEIGEQMVAQGWQIALDQDQSLVVQAARTRQGVTVNDVQADPNFLPNPLLPDTRAEMAVPLVAGNKLLGVLDIQADVPNRFTREDIQIQTTLATQIAVALENAHLFAQTQTALTEAETLYDLTGMLSGAVSLEDALQTAISPFQSPSFKNAALFAIEPDENGQPTWIRAVATWDQPGQQTTSVGDRFYLPDFSFARFWVENPDEPALLEDISADPRVDPVTQAVYGQLGIKAAVNLQLRLEQRWMGLLSLSWSTVQQFGDKDRRLYHSIAAQMAVVMNNLLLLSETKQRAAQLEKLSKIETDLSQAQDEAEILAAIAQVVGGDSLARIAIQYLETDENDWPTLSHTVASWRDGALWPEDPALGLVIELNKLPTTQLWASQPDQALFITDIAEDPRVDEISREFGAQMGIRAFAVIPLHSAGSWQGNITFSWPEPYLFSDDEQFIIRQLLESLSSVVATRRAYLAAEAARQITENLYNASRRINETSDLQEMLAAVAEDGPVGVFNRGLLFLFEYNALNEVESIVVAANWYGGQGRLPTEVGTRYSRPALDFTGPSPLFFDDIQLDSRASAMMQDLAKRLDFRAVAALPLWTSTRQLGTLFLEAEVAYSFSNQDIQPYVALARQVAVAIENQRLFEETRRALAEVEATQRRYTLQTWEIYQNRVPLKEYEKAEEGLAPLNGMLPRGVSEAIQHKQVAIVTQDLALDEGVEAGPGEYPESAMPESNLIIPLTVRDEVIGVLGLQEVDPAHHWLPEEIELVQAIAEEIALAAENIRLLDDTQQRAAREQRVNEIGEKIRTAQTLEEALQIAVKEVGLSLKAPQTVVKLEVKD